MGEIMATVLEPSLARAPVRESSDRSFGLVFAAVFSVIGCLPLLCLERPRWWAFGVAAAFALSATVWPDLLRPRTGHGSRSGACCTGW